MAVSTTYNVDPKAVEGAQETVVEASPTGSISEQDRESFLASFTAEEDRRIMRKVDRRFLLLIGLMYMLKNIDYMNAAVVKVLQVGQPRNILVELNMTADQYNWVQSIYFVSASYPARGKTLQLHRCDLVLVWGFALLTSWLPNNRSATSSLRSPAT